MPAPTDTTRTVTKADVEKGKVTTAIIPYVPIVDEEDKDPDKTEVKLPNGNKVYLPFIQESADHEQFLTRSIAAKLNITKDLKMQFQAEELERVIKNANNLTRKLLGEISKLTPTPTASTAPKAKSTASKSQPKSTEEAPSAEENAKKLEELNNKLKTANEQKVKLKNQLKDHILVMLDTFRGYIAEDLRHSWNDIISSKYDTVPWTNLQGEEEETELEYNLDSFEMMWVFWMRTVFPEDAAEQHQEYLTHCIRYPYWLPPRKFANRIKQLNGLTNFLPCVKNSPQATSQTTVPQKLTIPQLAQLLLRLCPEEWILTWKTLGKGQPQDLDELVKFMEQQYAQAAIQKSKSAKGKPQHDGNNKGKNKRKGDSNHNTNGPNKKARHCNLCKEHGGPFRTHNTADCGLYNADGTSRKRGKSNSNGDKKTQKNNFAQQFKSMKEEFIKCKKELKSLKRKLNEDQDGSDSDA
jgi:hypothetical protein